MVLPENIAEGITEAFFTTCQNNTYNPRPAVAICYSRFFIFSQMIIKLPCLLLIYISSVQRVTH